jgi:hypothetical protein
MSIDKQNTEPTRASSRPAFRGEKLSRRMRCAGSAGLGIERREVYKKGTEKGL